MQGVMKAWVVQSAHRGVFGRLRRWREKNRPNEGEKKLSMSKRKQRGYGERKPTKPGKEGATKSSRAAQGEGKGGEGEKGRQSTGKTESKRTTTRHLTKEGLHVNKKNIGKGGKG